MLYEKPNMEILKLETEDVIRTSTDSGVSGVPGPWDEQGKESTDYDE